jgi:hypothetical protein
MRAVRFAIAAFVLFFAGATAAAADDQCSDIDFKSADKVVYTLGTWNDVEQFFEKYAGCDDGDVGLELSDRVSDLLANHWDTLDGLKTQFDKSQRFEKFLFFHIDPTVMPDRYPKILDNAKNHCPDGDGDLCAKIAAAASSQTPIQ